jgi:hypothetical protein
MAKKEDKSTWATGGGVLLGLGVGFFSYQQAQWHLLEAYWQD